MNDQQTSPPARPRPASARATGGGAGKQPPGKKRRANGLVALSAAAVMAVYGAGYARTAPAAASVGVIPVVSTSAPVAAAQLLEPTPTATATSVPTATATTSPTTAATATTAKAATSSAAAAPASASASATATTAPKAVTATPTTTAATTAASALRDGTYSGTGTSRHGSITVAVVVQGGRVVSADITNCGTRYPCSKIAALPGQVVARQSSAVDVVSGATDSTTAYRGAVAAALAQAQ